MNGSTKRLSVGLRLNGVVAIIFIVTAIIAVGYSYTSQRDRAAEMATLYARESTTFYFDSLNTMMLTATMGERSILRNKILRRPGILEARVIRGQPVAGQFGPGWPEEQVVDDLDRRALKGEEIITYGEKDGKRTVTVITPFRATENTRGVNCLQCHIVPSGSINGAIRITYSMEELDGMVQRGILHTIGVYAVLFVISLIVLGYLLRASIIRPLLAIRDRLRDIAQGDGDLTAQLDTSRQDEFGEVASLFNGFVTRLRNIILEVKGSVSELGATAGNIATIAGKTTHSVGNQHGELTQTAAAVNEMTATVQEVARNANAAADAANTADAEASQGREVVRETIDAIHALAAEVEQAAQVIHTLNQNTTEISKILDVIGTIAEQTNLLALNAAIEAARAGEQGRGFAVVADEVRALASRTQQSTRDIQVMIEKLQSGASQAVKVMEHSRSQADNSMAQAAKAGEALDHITSRVATINDMNTQIASAAEQQSAVSAEIDRSITRISQAADQTSNDAQATAAASQQLNQLAQQLERLVNQFKV